MNEPFGLLRITVEINKRNRFWAMIESTLWCMCTKESNVRTSFVSSILGGWTSFNIRYNKSLRKWKKDFLFFVNCLLSSLFIIHWMFLFRFFRWHFHFIFYSVISNTEIGYKSNSIPLTEIVDIKLWLDRQWFVNKTNVFVVVFFICLVCTYIDEDNNIPIF